jgi:hypothetical protein
MNSPKATNLANNRTLMEPRCFDPSPKTPYELNTCINIGYSGEPGRTRTCNPLISADKQKCGIVKHLPVSFVLLQHGVRGRFASVLDSTSIAREFLLFI